MDAIEIYQKILEVVKDQQFNDVEVALDFAGRKIRNDHWAKNSPNPLDINLADMHGGQAANSDYAAKAHAAAVQEVRAIVQEELAAKEAV